MCRPRTDPGDRGERSDEIVVGQCRQGLLVQPAIRQPLGEVAQRVDLPPRQPAARSWLGSTASSSAGDGRSASNNVSMRPIVRRVAATESCWPVTWNSAAPKMPIGGARRARPADRGSDRGRCSGPEPDPRCEGGSAPASTKRRGSCQGTSSGAGFPSFPWCGYPHKVVSRQGSSRLLHGATSDEVSLFALKKTPAAKGSSPARPPSFSPLDRNKPRPPTTPLARHPNQGPRACRPPSRPEPREPAGPRSHWTSAHRAARARGWEAARRWSHRSQSRSPTTARRARRGCRPMEPRAPRSNGAPVLSRRGGHPGSERVHHRRQRLRAAAVRDHDEPRPPTPPLPRCSDRVVHQGCTWLPTPRSSRIDSISQKVVWAVNTSAAASTPVHFSMTGPAAVFETSSRYPFTAAHAFAPYFWKYGVGSTVASAVRVFSEMSAMYCWCSLTSSRVRAGPGDH